MRGLSPVLQVRFLMNSMKPQVWMNLSIFFYVEITKNKKRRIMNNRVCKVYSNTVYILSLLVTIDSFNFQHQACLPPMYGFWHRGGLFLTPSSANNLQFPKRVATHG